MSFLADQQSKTQRHSLNNDLKQRKTNPLILEAANEKWLGILKLLTDHQTWQ